MPVVNTIDMALENVLQRRYQRLSSYHKWLAVITLLLNPPLGSISFFFWLKSRHSLSARKIDDYTGWSLLSIIFIICSFLCTLLILVLVALILNGVLLPSPLNSISRKTHHLSMPGSQSQNFQSFRARFSNGPFPETSSNGSNLWDMFENR